MGQALWQLCCESAEDFCTNLRPKLQVKGFLLDPAKDNMFMCQAIIVHFWIIWSALNKDRAVLDVFNNFFNGWLITQQARVLETVQARFAMYHETLAKDEDLAARGLMPMAFATTALQCLLDNENSAERPVGFMILSEVGIRLSSNFPAIRKFREQFTILGA